VGSREVLVAVAATIAGLVLLRWWPWLLLVGALLTLPAATPTLLLWPEGTAAAYAALAGASLALLLAVDATGGAPEKVAQQGRWVPAGLLVALLVATVTATVAAAAPATAGRGRLAATLGPIVGALVVGGKQALIVTQLRGGTPLSSYLIGADQFGTSAGLLVAAALAVVGLGVAASLGGRHRAAPAATGETGPVGKVS
jgi:branched-subunit amino acid transport protein AzlD